MSNNIIIKVNDIDMPRSKTKNETVVTGNQETQITGKHKPLQISEVKPGAPVG